jgi:hypothetical protein
LKFVFLTNTQVTDKVCGHFEACRYFDSGDQASCLYFRYLDRYRDIKNINEEVLRAELKVVHPFQPPTPTPKYPFLHHQQEVKGQPAWLKMKKKHMILKDMQWRES